MTITIDWSWFAFFAGVVSTLLFSFFVLLGIAYKQWKKNKKAAERLADDPFWKSMEEWRKSQAE